MSSVSHFGRIHPGELILGSQGGMGKILRSMWEVNSTFSSEISQTTPYFPSTKEIDICDYNLVHTEKKLSCGLWQTDGVETKQWALAAALCTLSDSYIITLVRALYQVGMGSNVVWRENLSCLKR